MSNFVSLDDAAKKLNKSPEELVEMLSRGDIFGYRDGSSWKFKPEEIDRVASESMDASDEESSLIGDFDSQAGSDLSLVPDENDSDVRLVANDDDDLKLADDALGSGDEESDLVIEGSDLELATDGGTSGGSDEVSGLDLGGEADVMGSDLNLAESGLISGDSDASGALGSDLELSGDDDDLVIGSGSDLALGTDSGINLMSPADSGISLEDEPLDLAASGISGLDLAAEGSDVNGSGAGSAVDFQQDEEFQLSPSGGLEMDDDSGSQVIELEDSADFGDAAVQLPADEGFDAFADVDGGGGLEESDALGGAAAPAAGAAVAMSSPEVPYSTFQVGVLLLILLLMCMSGILVTDVVRNLWAYEAGESSITSDFTVMVLSAFGL